MKELNKTFILRKKKKKSPLAFMFNRNITVGKKIKIFTSCIWKTGNFLSVFYDTIINFENVTKTGKF